MNVTGEGVPEDFTEKRYEAILREAKQYYRFEAFGSGCAEPHVLWRHDVDVSPHRALRLAQIEANEGVASTYFIMLHSEFYNLFERNVYSLFRQISALGHEIGLHFDLTFYGRRPGDIGSLAQDLSREGAILKDLMCEDVGVFSFHNPEDGNALQYGDDTIAGMISTYGKTLRTSYEYVSDSCGYWRHASLAQVVTEHRSPQLHVLTHPVWWTESPMSPRSKIERSINGRAVRNLSDYDALLERLGRPNYR